MSVRQEARNLIEGVIRTTSEKLVQRLFDETGREVDNVLGQMEKAKEKIGANVRALDTNDAKFLRATLDPVVALGSNASLDSGEVCEGGGNSHIVSMTDTYLDSETEDDGGSKGSGKRKHNDTEEEVKQEQQESLSDWKTWSARGMAEVDEVSIRTKLLSAVFAALVALAGFFRSRRSRLITHPQVDKDVFKYLTEVSDQDDYC